MSNGASLEYKFGSKNNWRRRTWNEITRRLKVHPSNATVVYLAGPKDLDRPIMKDRGFRDENMFIVERDDAVATWHTRHGKNVIIGDLFEALEAWEVNRPIHVLFGDTCCAFRRDVSTIEGRLWWADSALTAAVILLNFQRGRENLKNYKALQHITAGSPSALLRPGDAPHRGLATLAAMLDSLFARLYRADFGILPLDDPNEGRVKANYRAFVPWIREKFSEMRPSLDTYRNKEKNVTMDSVLWTNSITIPP